MNSPAPTTPIDPLPTRHSVLGIASVIIAIIGGISAAYLKVLARQYEGPIRGSFNSAGPELLLVGIVFLGVMALCFLGAIFGMGGIFERNRKLTLAVAGIIMNVLVLFVCIVIILVQEMNDV